MLDKIHLNKTNKKILDNQLILCAIYQFLDDFSKDPTSDSAEDLQELWRTLDESMEDLKESLRLAIQESVGIDSGEVQVEYTENGFKL
ncbi:MAG: hypothetical protein ACOC5T_06245 [Elusimicrobiota bacterium]